MSIEVNNSGIRNDRSVTDARDADAQKAREADEARHSRTEDRDASPRLDSVQLSRDAHSLQRLQERLERQDSFDQARVEAIRTAIENGRYPIDAERLASKFYELESQLNQ